jgi:arginyl-tRNA synthetase
MLAFEGNTAPYLMYAHARIRSILRKATVTAGTIEIGASAERTLALELLEFPATVIGVGETLLPHRLCQRLFQIATTFTKFYDSCPVLSVEPPVRTSRLILCELTAQVLALGLDLLGIGAPQQM